jgi:aminoglycoside phosphotransferase (APT) family kinase protein
MHNYIIVDGRPYVLDWEHIDLSDPLRDVGFQLWSFLPGSRWPDFLQKIGLSLSEDVEIAIQWWAALKMLTNATFNDRRGDDEGAEFHAYAFRHAVDRRPWTSDR